MANAIITLTTDYGTSDHLVGTLKGVILKINPDVTIVDITHNVTPFDLLDGALAIGSASGVVKLVPWRSGVAATPARSSTVGSTSISPTSEAMRWIIWAVSRRS